VLFDLDGTLVDVAGATTRCVEALVHASGARRDERAEIRRAIGETRNARGRLAVWTAEAIRSHGGKPPSTRLIMRELGDVSRHIEPDLRAVRTFTRVAATHRVAIVTNGPRALQRAKLRASGLSDLVPASRIVISGELGVRKPDVRIFRAALRITEMPADATLFVGDDEREDVEGARAAGLRTCRVAPAGAVTSADATVPHVSDIEEVLACET
jgi:HAD superfamily hydrolase (TIGR01549 family)